MKSTSPKDTILAYGHWKGIDTPLQMGTLSADLVRGKEILSFEYDDDWLHSSHCREIDLT